MRRLVGLALMVIACGSGSPSPTGPGGSTPAATIAGSATVAPVGSDASPSPGAGRVPVTGTTTCNFTSDVATDRKADDLAVYTATMSCTDRTSDPRVSGKDSFDLTETEFARGDQDINWFLCTNQTLETTGGTWRGACFGSEFVIPGEDGLWTSGYSILNGEGAYAGLVYHLLYAQSPWDGDHYVIAGWIEPAAS